MGNFKSAGEVYSGVDPITGRELEGWERWIAAAGIIGGGFAKFGGKGVAKVVDKVRDFGKGTSNFRYATAIDSKVTIIDKAQLPSWIQESFTDGVYRTVKTNESVTLYRTFGGMADAGGGFATTLPSSSRIQAKIDTALLPEWGNSRMYEAVIVIPEGQVLNIGKVAPQNTKSGTNLAGGGDQVL
ncbi:pre-toxin TG domain-containing protein, partial [Sutcliffiella cohnii]